MGKKGRKGGRKKKTVTKPPAKVQTQKKEVADIKEELTNFKSEAGNLLSSMMGGAGGMGDQSKQLFDQIFGKLLGNQEGTKLSKEEIQAQGEEQIQLVATVNENIDAVEDICEKIKSLELDKIEGLADLVDEEEVTGLRGIKLSKKQEKSLKKKNK